MIWDGPATGESLLLLAPHPDDETLSAGCLLQRTLGRGGQVTILFATDGENNPWTQRLVERRVRIDAQDALRFGRRRREEALAALQELGIPREAGVFLGFPDQRITDLLLSANAAAIERLAAIVAERRPAVVVVPSPFDLHPDHSALAVLASLALERAALPLPPRLLSYLIHRRPGTIPPSGDGPEILRLVPRPEEIERKRRAIGRHATQLTVHRRKFLAFASRPEVFLETSARPGTHPVHPVRRARLSPGSVRLDLVLRPRLGAFGRPRIHLAADGPGGRHSLSFDVRWRRGGADVKDLLNGRTDGRALLQGGHRGGTVVVPLPPLPGATRFYVKVERRFGFFDEGGWLEVVPSDGEDS